MGVFTLWGGMNAVITVGSDTLADEGPLDDEVVEQAIALELAARIELYGGLTAYCRDFDLDRRNTARYLTGRRTPTLPQLMRHLANLNVGYADFFASVDERVRGNH